VTLLAAASAPHYAAATGGFKLIWLMIALPLIGAAVLLLGATSWLRRSRQLHSWSP
jgi:hypothetical protein